MSRQYSSKASKSTMSPGRRGRFMMSPFVKSIINNRLISKKKIELTKNNAGVLPLEESLNGTPEEIEESPNLVPYHRQVSRANQVSTYRKITIDFNKNFMRDGASLPFVQHMTVSHRKRWREKRTELQFNPESIQILIADDSVAQTENICAILGNTNVIIDTV